MNWRRNWQPTPVFLPGESQGRGSLVGYRLWGHKELDMTEALNLPTLACALYHLVNFMFTFGEGDGTPLQYSCLGNPMDGGAW